MARLIVEPSATAAWHRLVTDAAGQTAPDLDEDCESYLVFLLMRYLRRPEMVRSVLALDFLECQSQPTSQRRESLQGVGDRCLIFAGLFPEQAQRRRVRLSYFVNLGQTAYDELAGSVPERTGSLFHGLAVAFVVLTDVLRAVRHHDDVAPGLSAVEAAELALDTGGEGGARTLSRFTDATLIDPGGRRH